jgi:hypothetical protein
MTLADAELIDDLRLLEPPEPFRINPWMLAAAVGVLLLLWFFIRYLRATRGARAQAHAAQQAYTDALEDLERLFALVDREESRPYAIKSSAIIRRYIETRFELSAPRRSTEEFLVEAQQSPKLPPAHQESLREYLRICDLLKFARTLANRSELTQLHEAAVHFVKETRHAPVPATQAASHGATA